MPRSTPKQHTTDHSCALRDHPEARAAAQGRRERAAADAHHHAGLHDYVGRIAIGRVFKRRAQAGQQVTVIRRDGTHSQEQIAELFVFEPARRQRRTWPRPATSARPWDRKPRTIGNTFADLENPIPMPTINIDEPTLAHDLPRERFAVCGAVGQVPDQSGTCATG
jgi:predicted membrane GTPase involved in stress response